MLLKATEMEISATLWAHVTEKELCIFCFCLIYAQFTLLVHLAVFNVRNVSACPINGARTCFQAVHLSVCMCMHAQRHHSVTGLSPFSSFFVLCLL